MPIVLSRRCAWRSGTAWPPPFRASADITSTTSQNCRDRYRKRLRKRSWRRGFFAVLRSVAGCWGATSHPRRNTGAARMRSFSAMATGSASFTAIPTLLGQKVRIGKTYLRRRGRNAGMVSSSPIAMWTCGAPSAPDAPFAQRRDATWFTVIGRMKPGVALKQATADLATVQSRLGRQFPKPDAELTIQTEPLKDTIVGTVRSSLWLLYGSVSLLMLIACSNIAALLLARTAEREHEISIRLSLGASRQSGDCAIAHGSDGAGAARIDGGPPGCRWRRARDSICWRRLCRAPKRSPSTGAWSRTRW